MIAIQRLRFVVTILLTRVFEAFFCANRAAQIILGRQSMRRCV